MKKSMFVILTLAFSFACNPYKYKGQQTWLPQNKKGKKGGQHSQDHHHHPDHHHSH
ncbi:MAG: hypothetical protein SNJ77_04280 [Cytophagales bacterium]